MEEMEFVFGEGEIKGVIEEIKRHFSEKVILLYGEMGAGKTTFVTQWIHGYGVGLDKIQSPTYSIINQYVVQNESAVPEKIYHIDLFRLEKQNQLYEIGFEEIFDDFEIIFIEWPSIGLNIIEKPYLELRFEKLDEDQRRLLVKRIL